MQLIIAEKPSVAKHIAKALNCTSKQKGFFMGVDHVVTWAYGHLLGLYDAVDYNSKYQKWDLNDYPLIPKPFQYKELDSPSSANNKYRGNTPKQQLDLIRQLVAQQKVTEIVIATDWDREGQVIGDSIVNNVNVTNKPVYRLLLNEWTEKEIKSGIQNLIPNSNMKNLSDAGFCRQQLDWLLGINLTVGLTLTKGQGRTLNVGRVILPTVRILYDRAKEQEEFVKVPYYEIMIKFKGIQDEIKYQLNGETQFPTKAMVNKKLSQLKSVGELTVTEVSQEVEEEYPKQFFNLTGLQAHITRTFNGWTADKVLKVCQSLYEQQLITYPRTESVYLDETTIGKTKAVFNNIQDSIGNEEIKKDMAFKGGKSIFNSARVQSHGAIIPTYVNPPSSLTADEKLVYMEIMNRFISKFLPNATYNVSKLKGTVGIDTFELKEKDLQSAGWKKLYNTQSPAGQIIHTLNNFKVGDKIKIESMRVISGETQCPNDYTEADILGIMEHCGKNASDPTVLQGYSIGTSATRADIIKHIKQIGYAEQKGKYLAITNKGKYLINSFPVEDLMNLDFTGKMEKQLLDIEQGNLSKSIMDTQIENLVVDTMATIKTIGGRNLMGKCPFCGNLVVDGPTGYGCLGYTLGCRNIQKKSDFANKFGFCLTPEIIKILLKNQKVSIHVGEDNHPSSYLNLQLIKKPDASIVIEEEPGVKGWI